MEVQVSEEQLREIYDWVDKIPLSRPKKNIARDFSDGVLAAEVINHFYPKLVDLHNYSAANSVTQKLYNWETMNKRVFRRLGLFLAREEISDIVSSRPFVIEKVLLILKAKIAKFKQNSNLSSPRSTNGPRTSSHSARDNPCNAKKINTDNVNDCFRLNGQTNNDFANSSSITSEAKTHNPADTSEQNAKKDRLIQDMQTTIEILELKLDKFEQLLMIKDAKLQAFELNCHCDKTKPLATSLEDNLRELHLT